MFRLPSFGEIIALFYQPTKVAQAIKGIETAAQRADSVVAFNQTQRERREAEQAEAQRKAQEAEAKATDHAAEAQRAARVSTRLRELVA
jgi:hypothetical protein